MVYGATDEFGYSVAENPVHVHDLHATLLHLMGIDHLQLTYKFQGRRFRLTDVNASSAFFDVRKLTHVNATYLRALDPAPAAVADLLRLIDQEFYERSMAQYERNFRTPAR